MNCRIERCEQGFLWLVFANEMEADKAVEQYEIPYVCYGCFGGFMNALRIS